MRLPSALDMLRRLLLRDDLTEHWLLDERLWHLELLCRRGDDVRGEREPCEHADDRAESSHGAQYRGGAGAQPSRHSTCELRLSTYGVEGQHGSYRNPPRCRGDRFTKLQNPGKRRYLESTESNQRSASTSQLPSRAAFTLPLLEM